MENKLIYRLPWVMTYSHKHQGQQIKVTGAGRYPYECYTDFLKEVQKVPALRKDWKDGIRVDMFMTNQNTGKTIQWHVDIHWYKKNK